VEALAVIETEASRTLREMRAMVGMLRDGEDAELAPQPGVADVARLARDTGEWPRVHVQLTGDLDEMSPTVATATFRLAQESVTNALRHARDATRIDVHVRGDGGVLRLTVVDDGDTVASDRVSWGYGIVGMTRTRDTARRDAVGRPRSRAWLVGGGRAAAGGGGLVTIRVLVADDHDLVRTGLAMILDAQPDIEVIAQAADGREAVALARRLQPDVCLFDTVCPGSTASKRPGSWPALTWPTR
jgi:hypothetical protein